MPFVASFHCLVYNRVLSTALHLHTAFLGLRSVILEPSPSGRKAVFSFVSPPPPPLSVSHTQGQGDSLPCSWCSSGSPDLEMTNLQGEMMQTYPFSPGKAQENNVPRKTFRPSDKREKGHFRVPPSSGSQNRPQRRVNRGCGQAAPKPCVPH